MVSRESADRHQNNRSPNGRYAGDPSRPRHDPAPQGTSRTVHRCGGRLSSPFIGRTERKPVRHAGSRAFVQIQSIRRPRRVRARARRRGPRGWAAPRRRDEDQGSACRTGRLDEAAPANPAVYTWQYANRNIQVLNDAAIKAAKIGKATVAPKGCTLHFTPNGEFTGRMENCQSLLDIPQREVTETQYLDSLAALMKRYNEVGITSITERSSNADGVRDYQQLKAQGRLPLRVRVTIGIGTGDNSEAAIERIITGLGVKYDQATTGQRRAAEDSASTAGRSTAPRSCANRTRRRRMPSKDQRSLVQRRVRPRPGSDRPGVTNYVACGQPAGWQLSCT